MNIKVVITSTVPLNGGDASILLGMIKIITGSFPDKDIEFNVYASQAEISKKYYPQYNFSEILYREIKNVPRIRYLSKIFRKITKRRFNIGLKIWQKNNKLSKLFLKNNELKILHDYKSADFIISTGGTYLVENYNLESRLFEYEVALQTGTPLIFFTQSLGPFNNTDNRRRLKRIFKKSKIIFVRDKLSEQHLLELGIENNKIFTCADAAFSIADKSKYKRLISRKPVEINRIAISVREWSHFKKISKNEGMKKYSESIGKIARYFIENRKNKVVFISTCQGIPEYRFNDSTIAQRILQNLPAGIRKKIVVNTDFHHPEELLEILEKFDLVIATRMHMAILALCAGTPVFPIAYEFKTQELFKQMGMGEWVQDIETLNSELVINYLDDFIKKLPSIKQLLYKKVEEARKSSLTPGLIIQQKYNKMHK